MDIINLTVYNIVIIYISIHIIYYIKYKQDCRLVLKMIGVSFMYKKIDVSKPIVKNILNSIIESSAGESIQSSISRMKKIKLTTWPSTPTKENSL